MKCVNFTNKIENLLKKTAAGLLSAVFMLNIVSPMLKFDRVHAAGASWRGIFEKSDELADGTYKTAGDADDVVGYINFGQRPEVKYSGFYGQVNADSGKIKWLIVGEDEEDKSNKNIVLYSEEPLMSAQMYDSNSNSIFEEYTDPYTKIDHNFGTVYINHYESSNFRKNLQTIQATEKYFSSMEQGLMLETKVKATDQYTGSEYTTIDKLYGLHATVTTTDTINDYVNVIYAGENSSLPINSKY